MAKARALGATAVANPHPFAPSPSHAKATELGRNKASRQPPAPVVTKTTNAPPSQPRDLNSPRTFDAAMGTPLQQLEKGKKVCSHPCSRERRRVAFRPRGALALRTALHRHYTAVRHRSPPLLHN